jgi:hypothetical protein
VVVAKVFELTKFVAADDTTPFTFVVIVKLFVVVASETSLLPMIPAVVVATIPFTILVHRYELVEVETVKRLVVLEASRSEAEIF